MDESKKLTSSYSQNQLILAKRIFLDLTEVRGWCNVKLHEEKDQVPVFISGHPTRHEKRQFVLPVLSHEMVSPMKFNKYLKEIVLEGYTADGLTLAICETDTTTVYYKILDGLIPPESPESTEFKKFQRFQGFQQKKTDLDKSLQNYMERVNRNHEDD